MVDPEPSPSRWPEDLTPDDALIQPHYWLSIGMRNVDRGEPDRALEAFDQAIRLDPNFAPGYFNRFGDLLGAGATGRGNR